MNQSLAALRKLIIKDFKEATSVHERLIKTQLDLIAKAAVVISRALKAGSKIIWFGNGGSATQSQHMAAEFVGRFCRDRRSLASISLAENMACITAIGNDYSFEKIFARQLEGLAKKGDVAIGISTSGNSSNVIHALITAGKLKLYTIGLSGSSGGQMLSYCDICIRVPSNVTARIQEAHLAIGHILCALVEDALTSSHAVCAK